jgi:hypothetical protein
VDDWIRLDFRADAAPISPAAGFLALLYSVLCRPQPVFHVPGASRGRRVNSHYGYGGYARVKKEPDTHRDKSQKVGLPLAPLQRNHWDLARCFFSGTRRTAGTSPPTEHGYGRAP